MQIKNSYFSKRESYPKMEMQLKCVAYLSREQYFDKQNNDFK